jgi:hypothetical protein
MWRIGHSRLARHADLQTKRCVHAPPNGLPEASDKTNLGINEGLLRIYLLFQYLQPLHDERLLESSVIAPSRLEGS